MGLKPRTGPRPHSKVTGPDLVCSKEGKRDKLSGQTCACSGLLIAALTLSPAGAGPGFVSLALGEAPACGLCRPCRSGYIFGFHRREEFLIRELDRAFLAFTSLVWGFHRTLRRLSVALYKCPLKGH